MGRSLLVMGALMGSDVRLAGPGELQPPKDVVDLAHQIAERTGARITITDDPAQAVAGADFIHTDVWVSVGEPKDVRTERVKLLAPYQVNAALMNSTGNPKVKFMHCLPLFRDPNTGRAKSLPARRWSCRRSPERLGVCPHEERTSGQVSAESALRTFGSGGCLKTGHPGAGSRSGEGRGRQRPAYASPWLQPGGPLL